jgi:hypothetical protein
VHPLNSAARQLVPCHRRPYGKEFRVLIGNKSAGAQARQADGGAARFPLLGFVSRACGVTGGSAMMLKEAAVSIVLITAALPALAQTPAPSVPAEKPAASAPASPSTLCYEVVSTTASTLPYAPILVDRCTGRTWLLAGDRVADAQGKPTGAFAFRWHPLGNTAEEAVLAFPEPSPAASATLGTGKKPAAK